MKIVIADDSVLLRDRIKESLKDTKNIEIVGEAGNGIEAIEIIKEKNPDFVLLDIRMPELNGIGVLKKMKEIGSKAKVCIFTNYPYSQYKEKCKEEGADYIFDKNKDFKEVTDLIVQLAQK
ncbi:MAG: response regulator transcription factor [Ignavibacteriales bacterium]|nr:response regulator transcription factor [Ignavibacteriales bacterium]